MNRPAALRPLLPIARVLAHRAAFSTPGVSPAKKWVSEEGEERKSDSKVVRCRCNKSNRMPYCDNSHRLHWSELSVRQNLRGLFGGDILIQGGGFVVLFSAAFAAIYWKKYGEDAYNAQQALAKTPLATPE